MKNHILHLISMRRIRRSFDMKNLMQYIENVFFHFVECEREWCWQISWCGIGKFISMLFRYFSLRPPFFFRSSLREKSQSIWNSCWLTTWEEFKRCLEILWLLWTFSTTPTKKMAKTMPWRNIYYDGKIKHARNHFVAFLRYT